MPAAWAARGLSKEQLDQRRLPGAVLAHQPMHLAGPQAEGNVAQGGDNAEAFP
jgi:hypothetical protein